MFVPARHFCGAGPMNRLIANTMTCTLIGLLSIPTMAQNAAKKPAISPSQAVLAHGKRWIGTWATAPQPFMPGSLQRFSRAYQRWRDESQDQDLEHLW